MSRSAYHFSSNYAAVGQPTDAGRGRREDELAGFDLRDTLLGISVRETSFAEFLAALKQHSAGRGIH